MKKFVNGQTGCSSQAGSLRHGRPAGLRYFVAVTRAAVAAVCVLGGGRLAAAADWPTWRGDNGRTGFRDVALQFPLNPAWTRTNAAPRPAWGPPARRSYWQRLDHLAARVADDHCFPVVIAGDAAFYGSSADDRVRCVELATGAIRWTFETDGPVRYAPVVAEGRVFFGSDDGWVYAVGAADGKRVWRQRLGPEDWRIPGNGRLISSWPVRSGLLVDRGVVMATAGLYPQQEVILGALDATTGEARWRRSFAESPEGYLLGTERLVIVPTGRGSPVGVDRETGATVRTFDTGGGTFAVVQQGELFGGPGNAGTLTGVSVPSGDRLVTVNGRCLVATPGRVFLLENGELRAVDRARQSALERQARELERRLRPLEERQRRPAGESAGNAPAELAEVKRLREELAVLRRDAARCELWRVPCAEDLSLIGVRDGLIAGGTNRVAAFEAATGRRVWEAPVGGRALALAATDGFLVASTDNGNVEAFAATGRLAAGQPAVQHDAESAGDSVTGDAALTPRALAWLEQLRTAGLPQQGYALVAGIGSGSLVRALLDRTELHVIALDADAERVRALRQELMRRGVYGSRAAVHQVAGETLPFTDYFANLVIAEAALEGAASRPVVSGAELARVTRPFGGLRWTDPAAAPVRRGALPGAGEWTHQFGNPANTAESGDRRMHAGLRLQWFGGPGPDVMVDRHLRGPAPLSAAGRLFVPGENLLLAVDAYNGTTLWQRELAGSQRYTMPYDAGYLSLDGDHLAVAVRDACLVLRAADGEVLMRVPVPGADAAGGPCHWGYTALIRGALFGSVQQATASRTTPSYEQIDADYGNDQPLVTGVAVFRAEPATGAVIWRHARGLVLNPTIALRDGRVFFVEARAPELAAHPTGRIPLSRLMSGDPWLVALDAGNGRVLWEHRLEGESAGARSILYLVAAADRLALVGSRLDAANDTEYRVECRRIADGSRLWGATHGAGLPGAFAHGEQVHHPVILGDLLVAEPVTYDLATGRRLPAPAGNGDWRLVRPGHSCGTLSAAGDCLFFRANNPTVLDLRASLRSPAESARKLAPSRTGCWINMIPAGGLLLVPEASAGCVCQYSLQTSMGFLPWPRSAGE